MNQHYTHKLTALHAKCNVRPEQISVGVVVAVWKVERAPEEKSVGDEALMERGQQGVG